MRDATGGMTPQAAENSNAHVHRRLVGYDIGGAARKIQSLVAERYGLTRDAIVGKGKRDKDVRPRFVAMGLCRVLTPLSYPQIGRAFGGRHHTSVMNGVIRFRDWVRAGEDDVLVTVDLAYEVLGAEFGDMATFRTACCRVGEEPDA